jgi:hypothetical protein
MFDLILNSLISLRNIQYSMLIPIAIGIHIEGLRLGNDKLVNLPFSVQI